MKIHVLSDLHVEFGGFSPPDVDADLVVLAGDTHVGERGVLWAMENFRTKPVIYLMGNHEYYGHAYPKILHKVREKAAGTNVRVLENEVIALDGVRIFGCTLWTDFLLFGHAKASGMACREKMNDFRLIRTLPSYSRFTPRFASGLHAKSRKALADAVAEGFLDVVITHHAPSRGSLAEQFKDDPVSAAFVSDLDGVITETGAKLWIHGHVHSSWDYTVGRTRVLCNPRGYPREAGTAFREDLVACI